MNNSQLLYKISDLQYNIRMKEAEHARAKNAGEHLIADMNSVSLANLRAELTASVSAYNSIPANNVGNDFRAAEKPRWWQNFFKILFQRTNK